MEIPGVNEDWEHHVVNPLLQDMHCGDEDYFSAQDLLGGNTTTAPTTTSVSAQSPISETNPPSLSPSNVTQAGALSPGALSQTSQNAGNTNASVSNGNGATSASTCCENGRPIMTDPVSGQTVCSCQYDSARLALSGYSRLPSSSVYGTPYPSTDQNPYPSIGVDSSAFYSPLSNPYGLKDSGPSSDMSAWTSAGLQPTTGYYPYDPTLAAYGYGAGYDLAARRKNATRESTATLKAWLNEHKKNPYPTKGEKIMLAIITKMTLTQVSTWFANARRRLKKENKMTWEPKNKTDDDDDAMVSDDEKDKDDMDDKNRDHKDSMHHVKSEHDKDDDDDLTDDDRKPELGHHHGNLQHHPYYQHSMAMLGSGNGGHYNSHHHHHHHSLKSEMDTISKNQVGSDCGVPIPASKPKIWSLADTAACKTPPPHLLTNPAAAAAWGYANTPQHPSHYNSHTTSPLASHQNQMHHQQHPQHQQYQQYQSQQSQIHQSQMGASGAQAITGTATTGMNMNMITSGHHNQSMTGMSGMMNTFGGNSPYSRYAGGFQTGTHPTTLQQQQTQQHPYINNSHTGGSTTPVTPNSTDQTLNHNNQTSNNQTMGFPEVQTDTPPQTPPNMKLPSVVGNLLTTTSTTQPVTTDIMNNHSGMNNNNYIGNFRVQQQNDNSSSPQQQMMNQIQDGFKPFYKNTQQQLGNNNYVSPV